MSYNRNNGEVRKKWPNEGDSREEAQEGLTDEGGILGTRVDVRHWMDSVLNCFYVNKILKRNPSVFSCFLTYFFFKERKCG
jgi:hypothetical protein